MSPCLSAARVACPQAFQTSAEEICLGLPLLHRRMSTSSKGLSSDAQRMSFPEGGSSSTCTGFAVPSEPFVLSN